MQSMTIDELISSFHEMEDWEERCDYLIDLGFNLPDFPEEEKTEHNKVHGCQSNVWMIAKQPAGESGPIEILADSDAMIVKGLIAVLLTVYSEKTPEEKTSDFRKKQPLVIERCFYIHGGFSR